MAAHRTGHQHVRVRGTRGGGGRRRLLRLGLGLRFLDGRFGVRSHHQVAAEARHRLQEAGQGVAFARGRGRGGLLGRFGRLRGQARPLAVAGAVQRAVARQPGDARHEREAGLGRGEVVGLADQGARLLVDGLDQPARRVVRPARRVRLARDPVDQQHFPGAVVAAPGVPLDGVLLRAAQQQPLLHGLAQRGTGVLPGRRTGVLRARSAMKARSARTGPSKRRTRSTGMPAIWATSSAVAPALMRAWMSRGRRWLSTSISIWPRRGRSPRTAARSRSSIGSVYSVLSAAFSTSRVPSFETATTRSSGMGTSRVVPADVTCVAASASRVWPARVQPATTLPSCPACRARALDRRYGTVTYSQR